MRGRRWVAAAGLAVLLVASAFCSSNGERPGLAPGSSAEAVWAQLRQVPAVRTLTRDANEDPAGVAGGVRELRSKRRLVARLPATADAPFEVNVARGTRLRVRRVGAAPALAETAGGATIYEEPWPGVDVAVFRHGASLEELVALRRFGSPLAYDVEMPAGSRLLQRKRGLVDVVDARRRIQARFRAERAWDATGRAIDVAIHVDGTRLTVSPVRGGALPIVVDPTWEPTGSLTTARQSHTATLLVDGTVLIAGGDDTNAALGSAEIYDPAQGDFTDTSLLSSGGNGLGHARTEHTATALRDGRVLIVGGASSPPEPPEAGSGVDGGTPPTRAVTPLATTEIYSPSTRTFTPGPTLSHARFGHTATQLPDGTVLIVGGSVDTYSSGQASAELFDPTTDQLTAVGAMAWPRGHHTATELPDGRVVIVGGTFATGVTEIYDPATRRFSGGPALATPRTDHVAILDPVTHSVVFVVGGTGSDGNIVAMPAQVAEAIDAIRGTASPASLSFDAARNANGLAFADRILLVGGDTATLGCSGNGSCTVGDFGTTSLVVESEVASGYTSGSTPASLTQARKRFTMTVLRDGALLAAGGSDGGPGAPDSPLSSAEAFLAEDDADSYGPPMNDARFAHTATALADGRALVAGGCSLTGPLNTAELFDPTTGAFSRVSATMIDARADHVATLLPDGRVLLLGGSGVTVSPYFTCSVGADIPLFAPIGCGLGYGVVAQQPANATAGAEVFDPQHEAFTPVDAPALLNCEEFTATLLADGTVFVAGGYCPTDGGAFATTSHAYVIDPSPGAMRVTRTVSLLEPRQSHAATRLSDGTVLLAGGYALTSANSGQTTALPILRAEVYDPVAATVAPITGLLQHGRINPTAIALDQASPGVALISGGAATDCGEPQSTTEMLSLANGTTPAAGSIAGMFGSGPPLTVPRVRHEIAPLPDGRVLFVGGDFLPFSTIGSSQAESYVRSGEGSFQLAQFLYRARNVNVPDLALGNIAGTGYFAAATLLPTGAVLVTGGASGATNQYGAFATAASEVLSIQASAPDEFAPQLTSLPSRLVASRATVAGGSGLADPIDRGGGTRGAGPSRVPQATWIPLTGGYPSPSTVFDPSPGSSSILPEWNGGSAAVVAPVTPYPGPGYLFVSEDGVPGAGVPLTVTPAPLGTPCATNDECAGGRCVDDGAMTGTTICCNTPCNGTCMACSRAGGGTAPDGTCSSVAAGTASAACVASECKLTGDCAAGGRCEMVADGSPCSSASGVCENGECKPKPSPPCGTNADCAGDQVCSADAGTCLAYSPVAPPSAGGCSVPSASPPDGSSGVLALLLAVAGRRSKRWRRHRRFGKT
jgi:hypothetical protein